MTAPVFGIAGWKNAGKTTLTERLVAGFTLRGVRVATVKHSHHAAMAGGPETDSARHARAGAMATALVWPGGWMLDSEAMAGQEPDLPDVLARLPACDLVLVEGYKSAPHEKIELRRLGQPDPRPLAGHVPNVAAIAADHPVETALPVFALDDIDAIIAFIAQRTGLHMPPRKSP